MQSSRLPSTTQSTGLGRRRKKKKASLICFIKTTVLAATPGNPGQYNRKTVNISYRRCPSARALFFHFFFNDESSNLRCVVPPSVWRFVVLSMSRLWSRIVRPPRGAHFLFFFSPHRFIYLFIYFLAVRHHYSSPPWNWKRMKWWWLQKKKKKMKSCPCQLLHRFLDSSENSVTLSIISNGREISSKEATTLTKLAEHLSAWE